MEKIVEDFLRLVSRYANEDGIRIALVGGSVRDILLRRSSFDIDILVESDAIDFVKRHFPKSKIREYRYYRTCSIWTDIGKIDFASARQETYPQCASRPVISLSNIEKDLFRRDFTINSMAILLQDKDVPLSDLIDLYNGRADLEKGILDVLHDKSFCDDPLRILRGIRYKLRFGFDFSERCYRLIDEARENNYISLLPVDRLTDEYNLILKEPSPDEVLLLVKDLLAVDLELMIRKKK